MQEIRLDDLPSACIPTSEVADKVAAELAKVRKVCYRYGAYLHILVFIACGGYWHRGPMCMSVPANVSLPAGMGTSGSAYICAWIHVLLTY